MADLIQRSGLLVVVISLLCILLGFAIATEQVVLWALVALVVGILFIFGFKLAYEVQTAFKAIDNAAEHFAEGNFSARAIANKGFGPRVTHTFNSVADQLEKFVNTIESDQIRLEVVLNAVPDPLVALSSNLEVLYCNNAASVLFDVPNAEIIGRPLIEVTRDYEIDELVNLATGENSIQQTRLVNLGKDRSPYRVAAVPVTSGGDWNALLVFVDLSAFQRTEQVRRDFVNNVSHELRTPVSVILMLAESIENDDLENDEIQDFVGRITLQTRRLRTLTDELLDLSRIESGATTVHPEMLKLTEIFSSVIENYRPILETENIEVLFDSNSTVVVEADRAMFTLIVSNLIDNALSFSSKGSSIQIEVQKSLSVISLSVRDHGPGFPEEDKDRMFERFYKSEQSRATDGAGLGLAIVKHAVRNHGGTVQAENALDGGAIFTIRLPHRYNK